MILADALALCYRAHHALDGKHRDRRGFDVGALEMVTSNLRELQRWEPEVHLAWDCVGERTFRHALWPDYKAHRNPMPAPLAGQLPEIRKAARALGITCWHAPGFEADDVLATLAAQVDPAPVIVFSPDKDLLQIVTERVRCAWFKTTKNREDRFAVYDAAGVVTRMGVPPALVPDLLALQGDACDGLPGLPGVGPKRAVKMLEEWRSAVEAVAGSDEGSVYGHSVRQALELVRLKTDAPVEVMT